MSTKIRSSQQLYIDENLQVNDNQINGVADGSLPKDAINLSQLDAAVLGINNTMHAPVGNLVEAKAVLSSTVIDRTTMLIETLGLYRYDADAIVVSNDNTIIRPTNIASDSVAGRWYKMSSTITDHNNLSGLNVGDYLHFTVEEKAQHVVNTAKVGITTSQASAIVANTAKTGITTGQASEITVNTAKVGITPAQATAITANSLKVGITTGQASEITANTAKVGITSGQASAILANTAKVGITPAQATAITDNTAKVGITGAQAAAIVANTAKVGITTQQASDIVANNAKLTNANHTGGDVTGSGALTIGAGKVLTAMIADANITTAKIISNAVDNTKLTDMAANTIKGALVAGDPIDMTVAQMRKMLGWSDRFYKQATGGAGVTGSNRIFTVPALVISGTEEVFKNGILMSAGAYNGGTNPVGDYEINCTANPAVITFHIAPANNGFADTILVNYSVLAV